MILTGVYRITEDRNRIGGPVRARLQRYPGSPHKLTERRRKDAGHGVSGRARGRNTKWADLFGETPPLLVADWRRDRGRPARGSVSRAPRAPQVGVRASFRFLTSAPARSQRGSPSPARGPRRRLRLVTSRGSACSSSCRRKNVEDFTGPRERSDLGFITFDITADLENIFDWNVKQLFLYLSAEYSTKNNALNQVVLWDKIVLRGDNPKLLLKDMKTKYFFFDDGNGLKGNRNVTLTLSWNVVPNAGILPLVTGSGHVSVPFPDTYEITKSY
nr:signal peptidase complex subunit 3 [Odocoileus virginianus texanus]